MRWHWEIFTRGTGSGDNIKNGWVELVERNKELGYIKPRKPWKINNRS